MCRCGSQRCVAGGHSCGPCEYLDEPIINEFVTDIAGTDMLEYVEVLVPEGYDTSDLHIIGEEGHANSNQRKAVHTYPLGDLEVTFTPRFETVEPYEHRCCQ